MKLGFYDSGLGGLSVLKEFILKYGSKYSYVYYGDSARAPYGEKSPDQLKQYIIEISDFMQEQEVDIMISACNTSSMYLDELDLSDYSFEVISLNAVMKKFFADNNSSFVKKTIALLATNANIDSGRYKQWGVDIYPLKCPKLVPLIESGNLTEAKLEWQNYLKQIPTNIKDLVIGCTHYAFLVEEDSSQFNYINPAKIVLNQFAGSIFDDGMMTFRAKADAKLDLDLHFSKADDNYLAVVGSLLDLNENF